MQSRYRLTRPIRAIFDKLEGHVSVELPAGTVLTRHSPASVNSTTLFGMVGVYWEGRHYSVYLNDLLFKAEQVGSAGGS
jgi:hypothetical protein